MTLQIQLFFLSQCFFVTLYTLRKADRSAVPALIMATSTDLSIRPSLFIFLINNMISIRKKTILLKQPEKSRQSTLLKEEKINLF